MSHTKTIGLVAGGKQFPVLVAKGVKSAGHRLVVAGFTGQTNMDVIPYADVFKELKLGQLNKLLDYFTENGVSRLIMAGTIDKPKIMDVRHFDARALKLIFKRKDKGDSTLLRAIASEFESEGIVVAPAHEFLPELITPSGVLSRKKPTEREWEDLLFGWNMGKELGRLDIGQCLVVREGIVAAVEALEGTDETVRRGCMLGGRECVVVKVFKPGQEERLDLPSIGPDTIRIMAEGGATCLGIEAGRSLFFDREAALKIAAKARISIVGLTAELLESSTN